MAFVSHPYIKNNTVQSRLYQEAVLGTAINKNTLCVLPTGMGKTQVAILLSAHRLEKYPDKKILIMSPTRPLCAQHQKAFQNTLDVNDDRVYLITGQIKPEQRAKMYENGEVVIATPQTIKNDIKRGIIDMNRYSLLVVDECHRAVKEYAYTYVTKIYSKNPDGRILGLTASPGSTEQKIKHICDNLSIDAVEIRTETDEDVKEFVKEIQTEWIRVELPDDLKFIQNSLKVLVKDKLDGLRKYGVYARSKGELLREQKKVGDKISQEKNPLNYHIIAMIAETIKVWYLQELMETQSMNAARKYLEKLKEKKAASDRRLFNDHKFVKIADMIDSAKNENPKVGKLEEIVSNELKNKEFKIIIFSHYRDNISLLLSILEKTDNCRPITLIGQSGDKGLSQREQIEVIREYENGTYNCLITSPIGEEGLHLASADMAIFYDSVPSEIRTIQRRGRVGRTKIGKIVFLLAKDTRDETNYWLAKKKESNMKEILRNMQHDNTLKKFL